MRAREFIKEVKDATGAKGMNKYQASAIPNSHFYPDLDNSSGYLQYRFGILAAGMPDYPTDIAGPTGLKTVTVSYTDADEEILNSTAKLLGTKKTRLTSKHSKDPDDTNKVSPVANWLGKEINND